MKPENDFGKGVCDPIRQSEASGKMENSGSKSEGSTMGSDILALPDREHSAFLRDLLCGKTVPGGATPSAGCGN